MLESLSKGGNDVSEFFSRVVRPPQGLADRGAQGWRASRTELFRLGHTYTVEIMALTSP